MFDASYVYAQPWPTVDLAAAAVSPPFIGSQLSPPSRRLRTCRFNTYFNNCPYNTNPAGWAWPVYQEPFATLAANKTFRVGWPPAQEIYGRVGLLPDMPVDANYTSPTAQVARLSLRAGCVCVFVCDVWGVCLHLIG